MRVAPSRGRGSKLEAPPPPRRGWGVAPSRGRGSKPSVCGPYVWKLESLPRGGADRNMRSCVASPRVLPSLPRGGADRNIPAPQPRSAEQPVAPSRGRGSKQVRAAEGAGAGRRSLAGARIETRGAGDQAVTAGGRSLAGARIETPAQAEKKLKPRVAPSRGRGSKRLALRLHLRRRLSLPRNTGRVPADGVAGR